MAVTALAEVDGRRLRREQNRAAVIDAVLELFRDGNYQPSTAEIAARAGLSTRSLFRYFEDVTDLHRAAAAQQIKLALPLLDLGVGPEAPTAAKVDSVVRSRVRMFEQVAPAARALRAAARRHEHLNRLLRRNRAFQRQQLREIFAPELAVSADSEAKLDAVNVLCSFESYELLRFDQGLSRAKTVATIVMGVGALLDDAGGADADAAP
jgi:TetR/AcrR family transcriptional regulator, regulator of autoinduction and epiphytic fitness